MRATTLLWAVVLSIGGFWLPLALLIEVVARG